MKLWRKLAEKTKDESGELVRNGRDIKSTMQSSEHMSKTAKKSYPLLDALLTRAGMVLTLTAKQVDTLKTLKKLNGENTNEAE